MTISSYSELTVWQKSFKVAKDVYKMTKLLPKPEQFGLSSQLQGCAVSVPSNIAEGQQRNNIAAELEAQLLLAKETYGVNIDKLLSELDEVQKMLFALHIKLKDKN
jgi:hypothetical protein